MADHNKPVLTSTYTNFVSELDARFDDLALGLDPALTTATNVPTGTIRWSSAANTWQKWNGTAWNAWSSNLALTALTTTGSAGIGSNYGLTRFDVGSAVSAGAITDAAIFSQGTTSTSTAGQGVRVSFAAAANLSRAAAIEAVVSNGVNGHHLAFLTNLNGAAPTEKMRIDSSGNVTIPSSRAGTTMHYVSNSSTASNAIASWYVSNAASPSSANSFALATLGTSYTASGAYKQNAAVLDSGSSLTGGVSFVSQAGGMRFYTGGSSDNALRYALLNTGEMLYGATTTRVIYFGTAAQTSKLQINDTVLGGVSIFRDSNNTGASVLAFAKTRSAATGGFTAVASGDDLGAINFAGADGTTIIQGAAVLASVDGAVSTDSMPARLTFSTTPSGSKTAVERMRINSTGQVLFNQAASGYQNSNSVAIQPASGFAVVNHASGTASGTSFVNFGYNGASIGSILQNGTTGLTVDGGANLNLVGTTVTAPTPSTTDNSTNVATTAYVRSNALGVDQTWQNVTASRASATTYTNTTGKPIFVNLVVDQTTSGASFTFTVGGVTSGNLMANNQRGSTSFIVPAGATYSATWNTTMSSWLELR